MKTSFCALLLLVIQGAFLAAPFNNDSEDDFSYSSLALTPEKEREVDLHFGDEAPPYDTSILWKVKKQVHFVGQCQSFPSPTSVANINEIDCETSEPAEEIFKINLEWIENYLIPRFRAGQMISRRMIRTIIGEAKFRFGLDDTVHEVSCPEDGGKIIIVGDIHGQFETTLTIFEDFGFPSEKTVYIFNGDLVDRGDKSLECILMVFAYKVALRRHFFVTRGNHESLSVSEGTFYAECVNRLTDYPSAFEEFHDAFDSIPYGYVVDEQFFVCHGGLCPGMDLEFLKIAQRKVFTYANTYELYSFLWNDPCDGSEEYVNKYGMAPSTRGKMCAKFNESVTSDFLKRHDLELLIRSHQVVPLGAKYCHDGKCLTIFSAPNCRGGTNRGAVLVIDEENYGIKSMRNTNK